MILQGLPMYIIYDHPLDYPDSFAIRKWTATENGMAVPDLWQSVHESIEEAREHLPPGLYRLNSCIADDPKIIEVWL